MRKITLFLTVMLPVLILSQPMEGDKSISISGNGVLWPDSIRMVDVGITSGYFFRDNIEVNIGLGYQYTVSSNSVTIFPGVNYGFIPSDQLLFMVGVSIPYDFNNKMWSTDFNVHLIYFLSEMAGLKFTNTFEITPSTDEKTDKVFFGAILYY